MGRLLRKKTVKKKKPNEAGVSSPSVKPDADISQPAVSGPESTRKKHPQQPRKAPVPVKNGYVEKIRQYLREVKAELKKVTWPSRKQTVGTTAVVIVLVMIISVFLGLVDMSLSGLIRLIFQ